MGHGFRSSGVPLQMILENNLFFTQVLIEMESESDADIKSRLHQFHLPSLW